MVEKEKSYPNCCPKVVGCKGKKRAKGKGRGKGKGKGNGKGKGKARGKGKAKGKGKGKGKGKAKMKKNKEMNKSDGNDYSINPNDEMIKKGMKKLPDGNDYNLFTDADELFNEQIEMKIIDGKRYFNPKKKDETNR